MIDRTASSFVQVERCHVTRSTSERNVGALKTHQNDDDFLLREGLDLLAAFRTIRSEQARRDVITLIAAIVRAESEGKRLSFRTEPEISTQI